MDNSTAEDICVKVISESDEPDVKWTPLYLRYLMYLIPIITGVITNVVVILIIVCSDRIRCKPTQFILSIAIGDLLFVVIQGPFRLLDELHQLTILGVTNLTHICRLIYYCEFLTQMLLVFNLMAVCFERFVVICIPFHAKQYWTRKNCRYIIIASWLIAALVAFVEPLYVDSYCIHYETPHSSKIIGSCSQSDNKNINAAPKIKVARLFLLFLFPGLLMIGIYSVVIYHLWRSTDSEMDLAHSTVRKMLSKQSTSTSLTTNASLERSDTKAEFVSQSSCASLFSVVSATFPGRKDNQNLGLSVVDVQKVRRVLMSDVRRSRKRVIKMLLLIMVAFFICWGPKIVLEAKTGLEIPDYQAQFNFSNELFLRHSEESNVTADYDSQSSSFYDPNYTTVLTIVDLLLILHSTLNPIICVVFGKDFREMICGRCRCR